MTTDSDETTPSKRRGGRPPSRKRGTFAFRVTAELREKMEAAAAASGRPVSEEIEMRLEASFREPELLDKAVIKVKDAVIDVLTQNEKIKHGGPYNTHASYMFGMMLGDRIKESDQIFGTGTKWIFDDAKIAYIMHTMQHASASVISMTVNEYRKAYKPTIAIAEELGIDTDGLELEQVGERVADYFKQQAERSKTG